MSGRAQKKDQVKQNMESHHSMSVWMFGNCAESDCPMKLAISLS